MKGHTSASKTTVKSNDCSSQQFSRGVSVREITPPDYGIDFIDSGMLATAPFQRKINMSPVQRQQEQTESSPNRTGMPDHLKSGIESLSGISMNNVKVHYNSSQPAQLNALAYAQGNNIHLGPGQEKHLPHEAWHVVQQKQGRVKPTLQMKDGVEVNDDVELESEADLMGEQALTNTAKRKEKPGQVGFNFAKATQFSTTLVLQRKPPIDEHIFQYTDSDGLVWFRDSDNRWYRPDKGKGDKIYYEEDEDVAIEESHVALPSESLEEKGAKKKWIKQSGEYFIYREDGAIIDPGDETMDYFPGSSVWREGDVWDDEGQTWHSISEGGVLVERDETTLKILGFECKPYEEKGREKTFFGHRFKFSVWMKNAKSIKWLEKTNEPYVADYGMKANEWFDLYEEVRDISNVFKHARPLSDNFREYAFEDPPASFKEPNVNRTLEFKITFESKDGGTVSLEAIQVLKTDEEGNITEQSFKRTK